MPFKSGGAMTLSFRKVVAAAALTLILLVPAVVPAQAAVPGPCVQDVLENGGALSLVCVPAAGWNGELIVFAHGYISVDEPVTFYHLTLPDGTPLPALFQTLGYAFATTSYRQNGLAILEGADDIRELVAHFRSTYGVPTRTYATGVSEGALVVALLAERSPELFTAALGTCGPIGSFQGQFDHIGDFRVLFDYFFPGVIPGSPMAIPESVIENWDTHYVPAITAALAANPARALELMRVARAKYDPANPATVVNTTLNILRYNVVGTNDAIAKLGGNPFGNRLKWYFGSSNDLRLNLRVQRFTAAPAARAAVRAYETNGDLSIPLVTLHTTGDEVLPFWHELLYLAKADLTARGRFLPLPVERYGHCNFTANEVLTAFGLMVSQP
jgi:hypothetical protein